MKVQIIVNITHEDHSQAAESTAIEVNVPEFEAFTGPENFGEVFDQYERNVLKARNEAVAAATENYLSELAKKTVRAKKAGERQPPSVPLRRRDRPGACGGSESASVAPSERRSPLVGARASECG